MYGTRVSAAGHLAAPELDDLLLPRGAIEAACRRLRRLRMAILRRGPPQWQPAVLVRHGRLPKSRQRAQPLLSGSPAAAYERPPFDSRDPLDAAGRSGPRGPAVPHP